MPPPSPAKRLSLDQIADLLKGEEISPKLKEPRRCGECGSNLTPEPRVGRQPKWVCLNCPVEDATSSSSL